MLKLEQIAKAGTPMELFRNEGLGLNTLQNISKDAFAAHVKRYRGSADIGIAKPVNQVYVVDGTVRCSVFSNPGSTSYDPVKVRLISTDGDGNRLLFSSNEIDLGSGLKFTMGRLGEKIITNQGKKSLSPGTAVLDTSLDTRAAKGVFDVSMMFLPGIPMVMRAGKLTIGVHKLVISPRSDLPPIMAPTNELIRLDDSALKSGTTVYTELPSWGGLANLAELRVTLDCWGNYLLQWKGKTSPGCNEFRANGQPVTFIPGDDTAFVLKPKNNEFVLSRSSGFDRPLLLVDDKGDAWRTIYSISEL